jgi:enoyl-CoA hydratase/carnithine racemase
LAGFKWADGDDQVKVILQTGEGKLFTAGLDLQDKSVVQSDTVISDDFLEAIG